VTNETRTDHKAKMAKIAELKSFFFH